MNVLNLNYRRT